MSDNNMSYLYTAGGYAALIAAGYIAYHVSTQKGAKKRGGAIQVKTTKHADAEPRKEDRKKKQRKEYFSSEAQEASKKAAQAKAHTETSSTWADVAASGKDSKDDDIDNKEFAKQLAKAQEGHKLSAKTEGSSKKQSQKSVKQSRANQMDMAKSSLPLNATPSDGDDDQSSIASPETQAVDSSGVADMLEPAPAAPSVLRLTNTEEKSQQKFTKAPEKAETKKQRQNRKKAEAAKAARDDAEKERRTLEEKQRRQARIAEGRPAKDGSQFVKANGNNSAWTKGAPNGDKPAQDSSFQPLDTFDSSTPATAPTAIKQSKPATTGDDWASSLPSEEEQMELLKAEADEWNTVKTKSKKNGKKTVSVNESGDENAVSTSGYVSVSGNKDRAKPIKQTSKPANKQNFGAFSALTAKDDPAEDAEEAEEREEEWEV